MVTTVLVGVVGITISIVLLVQALQRPEAPVRWVHRHSTLVADLNDTLDRVYAPIQFEGPANQMDRRFEAVREEARSIRAGAVQHAPAPFHDILASVVDHMLEAAQDWTDSNSQSTSVGRSIQLRDQAQEQIGAAKAGILVLQGAMAALPSKTSASHFG